MNKILNINQFQLKGWRFGELEQFLELDLIGEDVWLAGGAIRSFLKKHDGKISDYDLFFKNLDKVTETRAKLETAGARLIFECPEGKLYTYKFDDTGYVDHDEYVAGMKIQLITEREYPNLLSVILSFDIGACMGGFDGNNLIIASRMIKDVASNRISLNILTYPVATLKRIVKYARKGYKYGTIASEFVNELIKMAREGTLTDESMRIYID